MLDVLNESAAEIFAVIMGGVVIYVAALARSFTAQAIAKTEGFLDEEARKRLAEAIERSIAFAETKGGEVQLDAAIKYVREMNPGDLDRLGLDGARLVERVKASMAARST